MSVRAGRLGVGIPDMLMIQYSIMPGYRLSSVDGRVFAGSIYECLWFGDQNPLYCPGWWCRGTYSSPPHHHGNLCCTPNMLLSRLCSRKQINPYKSTNQFSWRSVRRLWKGLRDWQSPLASPDDFICRAHGTLFKIWRCACCYFPWAGYIVCHTRRYSNIDIYIYYHQALT